MKKAIYSILFLLLIFNVNMALAAPLTVMVDGVAVTGFKGWIKSGILSLYSGEDATWEYGQKISFWHMPDEVDGKSVEIPSKDSSLQAGQMNYEKKDPKVNISTVWLKDFKYKLSFGKEKDFKIPVTIVATAESPHKIKIYGSNDECD